MTHREDHIVYFISDLHLISSRPELSAAFLIYYRKLVEMPQICSFLAIFLIFGRVMIFRHH